MGELLVLHPQNPQRQFLRKAAEALQAGELIVYPTDSCYALGCAIGDKEAMARLAKIRGVDKHHHFTLVCRDLSEIAKYAKVSNSQYRLLKAATPGAYTFILEATREVPKRLMHEKRRTIGIRVPDHPIPRLLLEALGEPLMSSTLLLPGEPYPLTDAAEIFERIGHQVACVLDGGHCGLEPTTIVDLSSETPKLIRQGKGELALVGLQ